MKRLRHLFDVRCVIHEIVSFLGSGSLLDFLSLFKRGSRDYQNVCAGFHGVFKWPLTRWVNLGLPTEEFQQRRLPGHGALTLFPHMQHLRIEGQYVDSGEGDGSIVVRRQVRAAVQETTRELRAALLCGYLGHLQELTISGVYLAKSDARALETDLLAILRRGCLKTLDFISLDIFQQRDGDDDDDDDDGGGGGGNASLFSRAGFAVDLLESMAAHLPLLRDFQIDFPCDSNPADVDLCESFLEQRWPSLTILRSPFVTRRDGAVAAAAAAAGGAGGAPPATFATAWAKGHFPRATTLVVSEWTHNPATRRSNLVRDLPADGLAQITQLVLMGRALKSPLLNFIHPGQLTPQEAEFGGAG